MREGIDAGGAGCVIATASSEEKRASAVGLGAGAAIDGEPDGCWSTELVREAVCTEVQLECVIYVDVRSWDVLGKVLVKRLAGVSIDGKTLRSELQEIEWAHNDYEATASSDGDFIGWPTVLECEPRTDAPLVDVAAETAEILRSLWTTGYRAVAACDYEHLLPRRGGRDG
ncbi:hypothetical protein ACFV6E_13600 [Streptomyces sp. NPDC059785]|uniref:hypothetical protein n=1 Tax=unclassified Streptomyces TaxID=2593676 RepID=UPI0036526594